MNVRPYDSRLTSFVLGAGLLLMALALMAFAMPVSPAPFFASHSPLQQATITPTLTLTATVQTTNTVNVTSTMAMTATSSSATSHGAGSMASPSATPTGKDPYQPRVPNGSWEYIDANSSLWYEMVDSRMKLEVWLDLNGQKGVSLEIYAPEQKDLWNSKPIGQGTFNKLQPQHDLFWAGKTVAFGAWHVKVVNHNSFPINFSLNFDRVATRAADVCAACHGYEITFDSCIDGGDGFCGELESDFLR